MRLEVVLCADWSAGPKAREVYAAIVEERTIERVTPVAGGWTVASAIETAHERGAGGHALLGFDAALGVPASFWRALRRERTEWADAPNFAALLDRLQEDPKFFEPSKAPQDWRAARPFFHVAAGGGGRLRFEQAMRSHGVEPHRAIDRLACGLPVFIVGGIAGSVGSAASDIWRGLAGLKPGRPKLWPFDVSLEAEEGLVVGEIFPRLGYGIALGEGADPWRRLSIAKNDRQTRRGAVSALAESTWVRNGNVVLEGLDVAEQSSDAFDALFAAAAILRCLLEDTPLSRPDLEDKIAEGGILCSGSLDFAYPERRFRSGFRASSTVVRTSADRAGAYDSDVDEGANMPASVADVATQTRPATEDDLRATPRDGRKYELVDGAIVMSPAGTTHEIVSLRLGSRLLAFVEKHDLGHVVGSSAGFRLPGGNVRSPDVSFIAKGRFKDEQPPDDFADLAPDLAVEVVSPQDRPRAVLDKVGEYLQAGVRLIWVIDPKRAEAAVYRSLTDVCKLKPTDSLDGEDVLPGFRCSLAEILK